MQNRVDAIRFLNGENHHLLIEEEIVIENLTALDDAQLKQFFSMLSAGKATARINLSNNALGKLTDARWAIFCHALAETSITRLDLSENGIDPNKMAVLGNALIGHKSLESVKVNSPSKVDSPSKVNSPFRNASSFIYATDFLYDVKGMEDHFRDKARLFIENVINDFKDFREWRNEKIDRVMRIIQQYHPEVFEDAGLKTNFLKNSINSFYRKCQNNLNTDTWEKKDKDSAKRVLNRLMTVFAKCPLGNHDALMFAVNAAYYLDRLNGNREASIELLGNWLQRFRQNPKENSGIFSFMKLIQFRYEDRLSREFEVLLSKIPLPERNKLPSRDPPNLADYLKNPELKPRSGEVRGMNKDFSKELRDKLFLDKKIITPTDMAKRAKNLITGKDKDRWQKVYDDGISDYWKGEAGTYSPQILPDKKKEAIHHLGMVVGEIQKCPSGNDYQKLLVAINHVIAVATKGDVVDNLKEFLQNNKTYFERSTGPSSVAAPK